MCSASQVTPPTSTLDLRSNTITEPDRAISEVMSLLEFEATLGAGRMIDEAGRADGGTPRFVSCTVQIPANQP